MSRYSVFKFSPFLLAFLLAVVSLSCQKRTDPPALASDEVVEQCRQAGFDARNLRAAALKNFVECLSGTQQKLRGLSQLLDILTVEELDQLLEPFRETVAASPASLDLMAGWLSRLQREPTVDDNLLDQISEDLLVMIETDWLTNALRFALPLFESSGSAPGGSDSKSYLVSQLDQSIQSGDFDKNLSSLAKLSVEPRLQAFSERFKAAFASRTTGFSSLVHRQALRDWIGDRTFDRALLSFSYPKILDELRWSDANDRADVARFISEVLKNPSQPDSNLVSLSRLFFATNRSVLCLQGAGGQRVVENLFHTAARRMVSHLNDRDQLNLFLLRDTPILLSASSQYCDMDPQVRRDLDENVGSGRSWLKPEPVQAQL